MHLNRRPRISALRWPIQSIGLVVAWCSRWSWPVTRPAVREDRPGSPQFPVLSRIVGVRREGAVLHVVLLARSATLDGRPLVHARDVGGAGATARSLDAPNDAGSKQTLTVTLRLN